MVWFAPLGDGMTVSPLTDESLAAWPDAAFSTTLSRLSACPVALGEIYMLAQRYPIVVRAGSDGPEAQLELRRDKSLRQAFADSGAWRATYKPMSLRLLPFVAAADGTLGRLCMDDKARDVTRAPDLQAGLKRMLRDYARGRREMGAALRHLIDAQILHDPDEDGVFRLDPAALDTDPDLAARAPLAIRLFHVILFSTRHLRHKAPALRASLAPRLGLSRDNILVQRQFLSSMGLIDLSVFQSESHKGDNSEQ